MTAQGSLLYRHDHNKSKGIGSCQDESHTASRDVDRVKQSCKTISCHVNAEYNSKRYLYNKCTQPRCPVSAPRQCYFCPTGVQCPSPHASARLTSLLVCRNSMHAIAFRQDGRATAASAHSAGCVERDHCQRLMKYDPDPLLMNSSSQHQMANISCRPCVPNTCRKVIIPRKHHPLVGCHSVSALHSDTQISMMTTSMPFASPPSYL